MDAFEAVKNWARQGEGSRWHLEGTEATDDLSIAERIARRSRWPTEFPCAERTQMHETNDDAVRQLS